MVTSVWGLVSCFYCWFTVFNCLKLFLHIVIYLVVLVRVELVAQQEPVLLDSFSTITILDRKLDVNEIAVFNLSDQIITSDIPLDQLLTFSSPLYVHNTGLGGITTARNNGNYANHTPIIWKGLNLQSATNGSLDLSLIPSNLFNHIKLTNNGSSLIGTGAISGALLLGNNEAAKNEIGMTISNAKNISLNTSHTYKDESLSVLFSSVWAKNDNAYPYVQNKLKYAKDGESTIQDEASNYGIDILTDINYRLNKRSSINVGLWMTHKDRNLASQKSVLNPFAEQLDIYKRFILGLYTIGSQYQNKIQFSVLDEYLKYKSNSISPSLSHISTLVFNDDFEYILNPNNRILIGWNMRHDHAKTNFFETKIRTDWSNYISYKLKVQKFEVLSNIRWNWIDWDKQVWNASLKLTQAFNKHWNTHVSFDQNHNLPNLNDLYWPGLGNPNLKSEIGQSIRWGSNIEKYLNDLHVQFDINLSYNYIRDKIIWSPDNGGIWRPTNESEVSIKSVQTRMSLDYQLSPQWVLYTHLNWSYSQSEVLASYNGYHIGKELIYTPNYNFNNITKIGRQHLFLQLESLFVGERYIQTDNKKSIDNYWVQNLKISYTIKNKNKSYNFVLTANNIWNKDYEVVSNYAMPLRYYELNFNYTY